jgi:lysophospholipase L1-like esterase
MDPSITLSGAGWATDVAASHSGGDAKKTTGNGDTATFVAPVNCRAIYLVHAVVNTGSIFSCTVDGVSQGGQLSCATGAASGTGGFYRVMTPLFRSNIDAPHTVVLTNPSGGTTLFVDAIVTVSGSKFLPSGGLYIPIGDSWTVGTGSVNTRVAYMPRTTAMLSQKLRRVITLQAAGLNGDALWNYAGHRGGIYALITQLASTPEFLTMMFGANDLTNVTQAAPAVEFARQYHTGLCLIEDSCDTSPGGIKVAIGTPPWLSPGVMWNNFVNQNMNQFGSLTDNLEEAAALTRAVVDQFPWCSLADVFAAMDYRTALLVPNGANDLGLHCNDMGHGVVATEFARALISLAGTVTVG